MGKVTNVFYAEPEKAPFAWLWEWLLVSHMAFFMIGFILGGLYVWRCM